MITLRRILGLALAATALWLLWVLAGQVGVGAALAVAALLAGLVLVVWGGHRGALRRPLLPLGAVGLALAAILLPLGLDSAGRAAVTAVTTDVPAEDGAKDWAPLDEAAVKRLVGEGRLVFVDVTADWCLTCQVNKALVIDQDKVQTRFRDGEVVTMRGDWTLPSDEITRYLNSFGRYGIPFNAVFGPAAPQGVVLPELLTVEAVMKALDKAAVGAEARDKGAEAKEKGG
jgi:suppressor for copper-sensitivity B